MGQLSEPINVRLPVRTLERIKRVSEQDGIQVSVLVRSAVMRAYPTPTEGTESTLLPDENGAQQARRQAGAAKQSRPDQEAIRETTTPATRRRAKKVAA